MTAGLNCIVLANAYAWDTVYLTGYLFDIWGNSEVATLAKSIRHTYFDIANAYAQVAAYYKTVSHLQLNE